jgi:hypothetical protein
LQEDAVATAPVVAPLYYSAPPDYTAPPPKPVRKPTVVEEPEPIEASPPVRTQPLGGSRQFPEIANYATNSNGSYDPKGVFGVPLEFVKKEGYIPFVVEHTIAYLEQIGSRCS